MNNERYNFYKEHYPDWSEEQIWTAISIDMQMDKTLEDSEEDFDLKNPEVLSTIIRKAGEWLKAVLPNIFERIGKFFDQAIATVLSWAKKGLQYLQELIGKAFDIE